MLRKILLTLSLLSVSVSVFAQQSRHFTFHYAFTVKNVPFGKRVRIWIPAAQSDDYQEIKIVSVKGDLTLKETRESKDGNEIYFAETTGASAPELHFDIEYDVTPPRTHRFESHAKAIQVCAESHRAHSGSAARCAGPGHRHSRRASGQSHGGQK